MLITSNNDNLTILLRLHQFIKTRRRGSRNEIAEQMGVGKNKLTDMIRLLRNRGGEIVYNHDLGCYEYLNDFEFFIGPVRGGTYSQVG